MSFMLQIDESRPTPIDQLAYDFLSAFLARKEPTIEFCRRVAGVAATGESECAIARRIGVSVEQVRGWREVGAR